MSAALLPCPFCGDDDPDAGVDGEDDLVQCPDCGAQAETHEAWNRRVDGSAIEATDVREGTVEGHEGSASAGGTSSDSCERSSRPAEVAHRQPESSPAPPVTLADAMRELAQEIFEVCRLHDHDRSGDHGDFCDFILWSRRLRALAAEAERPRFSAEEREALLEATEYMADDPGDGGHIGKAAAVIRAMLSSAEGPTT